VRAEIIARSVQFVCGRGVRRASWRCAIAAAGREARVVHLPPPLLFALAAALQPVYPRMAEVVEFITQAFTNDFVAPRVGSRQLRDHFAGLPAPRPHPDQQPRRKNARLDVLLPPRSVAHPRGHGRRRSRAARLQGPKLPWH
jgi:hypothetical protein